jgi:nicotinamide riboside kinase
MDKLFEEEVSMKIGICGAQSVGKTTLLNSLRSEPILKNFVICNEVTRRVRAAGFPINEDGNDKTQHQIILEHFYNLMMYDDMITDRTLIDSYVYTRSLHLGGKVSNEVVDSSLIAMLRNYDKYDVLFFIEPEFAIEDDGERSADQKWQAEINSLFVETLRLFNIPFTKLSGSVANRTNQAIDAIQKKGLINE